MVLIDMNLRIVNWPKLKRTLTEIVVVDDFSENFASFKVDYLQPFLISLRLHWLREIFLGGSFLKPRWGICLS